MEESQLHQLRIAIVHYWFASRRGGELTVEAIAELFPQADIFALVADKDVLGPSLRGRHITTSFIQRIPFSSKIHRYLLPLYPLATEQFDLTKYDVVISSESGPAKGVITRADTLHICYCHTPMRYLWDMYHDYRNRSADGRLKKFVFTASAHYLRQWDLASAARVDAFVANSKNVANRIRKHYRREAVVIHPPVHTDVELAGTDVEDFYLCVGQLVDYKRIDLAIQACTMLGRKLVIIGDGEEYKRLRKMAGPMVTFLGSLPWQELHSHYDRCRALLFPGEEDFGIVQVEAQAHGRPVIAFGRGGALECVDGFYPGTSGPENSTGVFFAEQSPDSLIEAIRTFEGVESSFNCNLIRLRAKRFDVSRFKAKMHEFVVDSLAQFRSERGENASLRNSQETSVRH